MSQLSVMILRMDDPANPNTLTEVWSRPLPAVTLEGLEPTRYLDGLESTVTEVGWEVMRRLLVEQWRLTDQALVTHYRQENEVAEVITSDGYDALKVVTRFGVVYLPRQVCYRQGEARHILPGNAGLPPHEGQVTTRGLQEWVGVLPQAMPFSTAHRLLGCWTTLDSEALSETQMRRWVATPGKLIREAEQAETQARLERADLTGLQANLAPVTDPRRPAAWAAALNQAVETALAQPNPQPPAEITPGDWERVLPARQAAAPATAEQLRRLGPEVPPGEIVASPDDVQVRRPDKRRWLELRTA